MAQSEHFTTSGGESQPSRQQPASPSGPSPASTGGGVKPDGAGGEPLIGEAREQARSLWQETRAGIESRKTDAAAGIGDLAGALRNSARDLSRDRKDTVAQIVERAADSLESLASAVRSRDLDAMVREVESFARRQPAVFLGAAVAAGFLAMRFLKSSRESDESVAGPGGNRSTDEQRTVPGAPLH